MCIFIAHSYSNSIWPIEIVSRVRLINHCAVVYAFTKLPFDPFIAILIKFNVVF